MGKFTSARLRSLHSQNLELWEILYSKKKLGSSHHQIGEVHFRWIPKFKTLLNNSTRNLEVHFECARSSLRTKKHLRSSIWTGRSSQYFRKFTFHRRKVHLPPYGSSLHPYRSSYFIRKFTPCNMDVRLEVQMLTAGSSHPSPGKFRYDGCSLYFLKFTSN
jgi:hypothetical protein